MQRDSCRLSMKVIPETNELHSSKQLIESAYKMKQKVTNYKMSSDSTLSLLTSENL